MRWGFLPGFVKDPKNFPLIINARAETMADRPSYRRGAQAAAVPRHRRRLLRMAEGRQPRAGARRGSSGPYLIRRASGEPMGFAGLYETWSDPSGGEIDTACIVTTAANALAGSLHDRMPAILEPDDFAAWLDVDGRRQRPRRSRS